MKIKQFQDKHRLNRNFEYDQVYDFEPSPPIAQSITRSMLTNYTKLHPQNRNFQVLSYVFHHHERIRHANELCIQQLEKHIWMTKDIEHLLRTSENLTDCIDKFYDDYKQHFDINRNKIISWKSFAPRMDTLTYNFFKMCDALVQSKHRTELFASNIYYMVETDSINVDDLHAAREILDRCKKNYDDVFYHFNQYIYITSNIPEL